MTWVAIGVGVAAVSTGAGMIQANQTRQKQKGIIGQAYETGQKQLNLSQLNAREDQGESAVARGLAAGGNVRLGTAAHPGDSEDVSGASDLGGQGTYDLRRQQVLEQNSLLNQKNAALAGVNETANQSMINAGAEGVSAGLNLAANKPISTAPAVAAPPQTPTAVLSGDQGPSSNATASPYSGYGGIDPVNPLGRGAWAPSSGSTGAAKGAATVGDFNVNG